MAARRLIVFRHDSVLGNAPAHKLFERVTVKRAHQGATYDVGQRGGHNLPPARAYSDYAVDVDRSDLPGGVQVIERI